MDKKQGNAAEKSSVCHTYEQLVEVGESHSAWRHTLKNTYRLHTQQVLWRFQPMTSLWGNSAFQLPRMLGVYWCWIGLEVNTGHLSNAVLWVCLMLTQVPCRSWFSNSSHLLSLKVPPHVFFCPRHSLSHPSCWWSPCCCWPRVLCSCPFFFMAFLCSAILLLVKASLSVYVFIENHICLWVACRFGMDLQGAWSVMFLLFEPVFPCYYCKFLLDWLLPLWLLLQTQPQYIS